MPDEEIRKRIDEHHKFLGKRVELVAYKNYTQLLPYFTRILKFSRIPFIKRTPFWVNAQQTGMLQRLSEFQAEASATRAKLRATVDEKEKSRLEHELLIRQEWIRVFQTITDGIAWRVLNFDRPTIRLLSENNSPGHIDSAYAQLLSTFLNTWSEVRLINDLTRCLRIGDITQVKDGKIVLFELKEDGEVVQNVSDIFDEAKKHGVNYIFGDNRLARQRHRHWTAQMSIINRSIDVPLVSSNGLVRDQHRAEIVDSDIPIPTHFAAIRSLIKKANRTGFEQKELEDGYFVEVTAWDKLASNLKDVHSDPTAIRKKEARSHRPTWFSGENLKIMDLSSFESFHREGTEYPRNILPYSVVPFKARDCARLMMGCLEVKVFLNLAILKQRLEAAGWQVREIDHELRGDRPKQPHVGLAGEFMGERYGEDFYDLSKTDEQGTYHTVIPLTMLIFALSSFYKIDFMVNAASEMFERGRREGRRRRNMTINFLREREVLV